MATLARSTIQHIIRMHSQACYMSYQLWHIHISLPWCGQPNRNREMEPLLPLSILLSFSFHFLFQFSFQLISSSLAVLFCPLLPSHSLAALIYYFNPSSSPFSLSVHVLSHFLPPPLSSPFNFSRSPLCSPLTPSSERPIRLHRGFTGWGCEGKPKWNAAHLLEWNQDGFSSITPYAPPGLLLLQLHCTKKPQNTSSKHVWLCVCLRASHYLHNTVCGCVCVHLIVYTFLNHNLGTKDYMHILTYHLQAFKHDL